MKRGLDGNIKRVPVVLLGVGGVGLSLLGRILKHREYHAERYGCFVGVVAVADSGGAVIAENGFLGEEELRELIRAKQEGISLSRMASACYSRSTLELVNERCEPGTLVVDCTATSATQDVLLRVLEIGGKIVLANKKPLTGDLGLYRELTRDPGRSRWETTVGSSLPVISALNRIVSSGDIVVRISGSFSGTLGLLMTSLQEGQRFGAVVRAAHEAGYTEPDPREDLSGMDVARKALILARGAGWSLDLSDIDVESLVPEGTDRMSPQEFLGVLEQSDGDFAERVDSSRAWGRVLRYTASVEHDHCRVGLSEVEETSPLGRLRGNDNLAQIHTQLFSPNPLIIQGRGAGVDATAAGVLSDLLELVGLTN
jgi:aspartokinase/homoserine dehydrogenase 1